MIVRCTQLVDAFGDPRVAITDSWLTVGREYRVLEIECTSQQMLLRLLADDGVTPILVAANAFMTVDDEVPRSWAIQIDRSGSPTLTLGPRAWSGDFWKRYFDNDAAASELFEKVRLE